MDYKDLLKNKKMLLITFISFFFLLSYYLDAWATANIPSSTVQNILVESTFKLNYLTSKLDKNSCSIMNLCYSDLEKNNGPDLGGFKNASLLMKIYLILLVVALALFIQDENKYKLYIEGIFGFIGILGIIIIITFIQPASNKFIEFVNNQTKSNVKSTLSSSSYLLLLSSLGCIAFAGLSYTKKI